MLTGLSPFSVWLSSQLQLRKDWVANATSTPHIPDTLLHQVRFGLFRFRSPLLTVSQLISFPLGTQMFPFPQVHVPQREQEKPRRVPPTKSHSGILGSTDACSYPRHIAACHALLRLPSQAIHHTASARRMVTLSTNAYATYARRSSQAEQTLATSFNRHLHADLHLDLEHTNTLVTRMS